MHVTCSLMIKSKLNLQSKEILCPFHSGNLNFKSKVRETNLNTILLKKRS